MSQYQKKCIERSSLSETCASGKLVRCVRGAVLDVAVDINPLSKNFCNYFMIELSEKNNLQLWIPEGYAHGFLSLEDDTCFQYKCTTPYNPSTQKGLYGMIQLLILIGQLMILYYQKKIYVCQLLKRV